MDDKKQSQRIRNSVIAVIILIVAVSLAYGGFYTVSDMEQAVITQFGEAVDVVGAGMHFKIPIVQQYNKVDMTIQGMEFGYYQSGGTNTTVESESLMITKDFNFVEVDFFVEWQVQDPVKYMYNSEDPVTLLRNILQAEARNMVSSYDVDEVLTTAKTEIQNSIRDDVAAKLEEYDMGINIISVSLQDAEPPTEEVIAAFKNVENAKQNMDTLINEANAYYSTVIPAARTEADKIQKDAEAVKEARINDATGQTARFNEMFNEYSVNKEITETRMYLEAMEAILPGVKLYIDGGGDTLKILNLEDNANQQGGGVQQ